MISEAYVKLLSLNLGPFSYLSAALCFAVPMVMLRRDWRRERYNLNLLVATAVSSGWLLAVAASFGDAVSFEEWALTLEPIRNLAWFAFLQAGLGPTTKVVPRLAFTLASGYVVAGLDVAHSLLVFVGGLSNVALGPVFLFPLRLGQAVIALLVLEFLVRNRAEANFWAAKFLYLSIGCLFTFDFYLYADALLLQHVDESLWQARGGVNAIGALLLSVAIARGRYRILNLHISQPVAFGSAIVIGAGVYLIVMAAAGYYVRAYGASWGPMLQAVFLAGAFIVLLIVLFSSQARAVLRVTIAKHFYRSKYDYRREWLNFTRTLAESGDRNDARVAAIRAIAQLVDSPGGGLWLWQSPRFTLKSTLQCDLPVPMELADCQQLADFFLETGWVVKVHETNAEPERHCDLKVPMAPNELRRLWILVPLLRDNTLLGFVGLRPSLSNRQLDWEDFDLLKTVGKQTAHFLALMDLTEALGRTRQFEAFNRLSAYMVHDLKNVVGQLTLIVDNAARHRHNPAFFDDVLETVCNAASKINMLLQHLRKEASSLPEPPEHIVLEELLKEVIKSCSGRCPLPTLSVHTATTVVAASRSKLTNAVTHLVQNSQEATAGTGDVAVELSVEDAMALVKITDNGCGMDDQFLRDRLFAPFETTKGNAGLGIGVFESRETIQELGGTISVSSRPGVGTTFLVRLPVAYVGERPVSDPADSSSIEAIATR